MDWTEKGGGGGDGGGEELAPGTAVTETHGQNRSEKKPARAF